MLQQMVMMSGANHPSATTSPGVTIFDHIEIPTRNKKLNNATKYIYDFLKGRTSGGGGGEASSDSISKRKHSLNNDLPLSSTMSFSGIESNFSDASGCGSGHSGHPQNVSLTYINPAYNYNQLMATTALGHNHNHHSHHQSYVPQTAVDNYPVSYFSPHASTVEFARNTYVADNFHNFNYRRLESGAASHGSYKKGSSTLIRTGKRDGFSTGKSSGRVKSKSIDRALLDNEDRVITHKREGAIRGKSSKGSMKKQDMPTIPVTETTPKTAVKEGKVNAYEKSKDKKSGFEDSVDNKTKISSKKSPQNNENLEEKTVISDINKSSSKKQPEKSAFKRLTTILNDTVRKSRSHAVNGPTTSTCSSSSVTTSGSDETNTSSKRSVKKEDAVVKTVVIEKTASNGSIAPPPAPPIDINVFRPVGASSFLTLKKSNKLRIPIPDDKMSKTFDIVLDELKSKLARIQRTASGEDVSNVDSLLRKPDPHSSVKHDDESRSLIAEVVKLRYCVSGGTAVDGSHRWEHMTAAKNLSSEAMVKMEQLGSSSGASRSLRHVDVAIEGTTDGGYMPSSCSSLTSSNKLGGCVSQKQQPRLASNRLSNVSNGGREEFKDFIVITKSDNNYECHAQDSLVNAVGSNMNTQNSSGQQQQQQHFYMHEGKTGN
jgi:hypothetical protein